MSDRAQNLTISVQLGRTRSARFTGPRYHVLTGWGMLLIAVLAIAFMAFSTPACSSASMKAAISILR